MNSQKVIFTIFYALPSSPLHPLPSPLPSPLPPLPSPFPPPPPSPLYSFPPLLPPPVSLSPSDSPFPPPPPSPLYSLPRFSFPFWLPLTILHVTGLLEAGGTHTEPTMAAHPVEVEQCCCTRVTKLSNAPHCPLPNWNDCMDRGGGEKE